MGSPRGHALVDGCVGCLGLFLLRSIAVKMMNMETGRERMKSVCGLNNCYVLDVHSMYLRYLGKYGTTRM